MTTPPTFSVGQTLTSAAMNSVGLWLVKSQTVGTGVSSVTVTDAFSADYDHYKITIDGMATSVSAPLLLLQLSGITGAVYYASLTYQLATSLTVNGYNGSPFNAWAFAIGGNQNIKVDTELFGVNGSNGKMGNVQFSAYDNANSYGGTGYLVSTSGATATGFTISVSGGGTLTGGTIRVYGYRK